MSIQVANPRDPAGGKRLARYWESLTEYPEKGYYVEWRPYEEKRSADQNKYLWAGVYQPIAEFLSDQSGKVITKEMVHYVAKDRFAPRAIVEFGGKSKSYPRSTTTFTKSEFGDYCDKVCAWGGDMGVFFDSP